MDKYPCAQSNGTLTVEVELKYESDVFLVDYHNFQNYLNNRDFRYYGGNYNQSHVKITVKGVGKWYLVVIGKGQYSYRFY